MTRFDTPLTLTITNDMQNPPQNVSSRYINNILRDGFNSLFQLTALERQSMTVPESDEILGYYYCARVVSPTGVPCTAPLAETQPAFGATPSQAVRRALEKFGVTFK